MGFTDYGGQSATVQSPGNDSTDSTVHSPNGEETNSSDFRRLPDQEILDGMEEIYFENGANCEQYELEVGQSQIYIYTFVFTFDVSTRNSRIPNLTTAPSSRR